MKAFTCHGKHQPLSQDKQAQRAASFAALALFLCPFTVEAGRNTGVPECPAPSGNQYMIRDFTNYSPRGARGTMNGKCEQSNVYKDALDEKRGGPMKHGACNYELEDHLAGKTNAVMGAVPLKGQASNLLGAIYKGIALDKAIGASGTYIYVGDTYGKGWHTRECKMDIITKAVKSDLTDKVNRAKGGELIKLARGDIPSSSRKVPRNPAALESVKPLAKTETAAGGAAVAKAKPKARYREVPANGPMPQFNPRKVSQAELNAYDQMEAAKAKARVSEASGSNQGLAQQEGRWAGSTTEEIDAYYDNFSLTPKAAPKTNRLKRNPASASEAGSETNPETENLLRDFDTERFGN